MGGVMSYSRRVRFHFDAFDIQTRRALQVHEAEAKARSEAFVLGLENPVITDVSYIPMEGGNYWEVELEQVILTSFGGIQNE